jgi:hypothetical protein
MALYRNGQFAYDIRNSVNLAFALRIFLHTIHLAL